MQLDEKIREIVAEVLNVPSDSLGAETDRSEIPEWDSLQHLNLAVALEQEFEVDLGPDDFEEMNSLSSVQRLVERKLSQRV